MTGPPAACLAPCQVLCGRPVTGPHKDLMGAPWLPSTEKLQERSPGSPPGDGAPGFQDQQ